MDMVYVMLNDKGQTEPVQYLSGVSQPLDANDPRLARLNTGPGSGRPVRVPNEHNEFVEAMEFTQYHYFVDENNKVIPIPPGSIVHGEFEDEEEEDDNMHDDLQENDHLRNDLAQASSEIAQVAEEMELPVTRCEVQLEEEVVPCSEENQELTVQSEPAEATLAAGLPVTSYGEFGIQEHSGVAAMDETGELHLENSSEPIFTQDEIELEEEVVSLQISEPELVAVKPFAKHSKRAAILTSHHDVSSSIGRNIDASPVGELPGKSPLKKSKKKAVPVGGTSELQSSAVDHDFSRSIGRNIDASPAGELPGKSPLKKSKKKAVPVGGTSESQASAVEKIHLQPGKKGLHHSIESHTPPTSVEPAFTDTGRPKRSVPRRSALEMLHGEVKARKPHASSESDSEVDGGSTPQHPGKKRQSKGAEKKALTADKLAKTPLLPNTECNNEAQLISTPQDLLTVNADQKCDETLEMSPVSNSVFITNAQTPVVSVKRGKGRPKKLAPESPRLVETPEVPSAMRKELVSMGSASTTETKSDGGHRVTFTAEQESSTVEVVVTSEIDVASKGSEVSDSKVSLTAVDSNDSAEAAFIDVVEAGGIEIKAEHSEVVTSGNVDEAEISAGSQEKPLRKSGRGRRKSTGEKKTSGCKNPKNAEEMDSLCVETEATIVKDARLIENEISVDTTTSEHLLYSPKPDAEMDGELKSEQVEKDDGDAARIVPEDLNRKEGGGIEITTEHSEVVTSGTVEKAETSAGSQEKPLKRGRGRPKSMGERKASGCKNPKNAGEMDSLCVETEAPALKYTRQIEDEISVDKTTSEHLLYSPKPDAEILNLGGELKSEQVKKDEGEIDGIEPEDLSRKEGHLATFERSSSTRKSGEENFSGNLVKEDCDSIKDICDDSTTSGHAVCNEVEDRQLDNGNKTVEDQQEEYVVIEEAIALESELEAEHLVESDVRNGNGELENTVASEDVCHLTKADEMTVEAEMYDANWKDSSCLVESQPDDQRDTTVEMSEELPGDETLEFENEPASADTAKNDGATHDADAEVVLCSDEKRHAPIQEEEEDATIDREVHEEDIQDFDNESPGEPEASASLGSELLGEEGNVDRMQISSQLTMLLMKHIQGGADEHGREMEVELALKKFKEGMMGLDSKTTLMISAELERLATDIRCRLADREADGDKKDSAVDQLPVLPREERVRRLVVAELMKLRALDQELDERRSQLMVVRGKLNRFESDVKQREKRLERSRLLLDLEKEALEEDRRKLLKEKESLQKQRKLYTKLRENRKRKVETVTELGTSSKQVCIAGPVLIKERRPLFEEMSAIKETKTLTNALQTLDVDNSGENYSVALQKQISSGADECESKDSVKIDIQILPDTPVEASSVKAEVESAEDKSCVRKSDVPITPSGVSTVVKGKKELLRRFEADELNSPGDEQSSNKSLSLKPTGDDSKPSRLSSQTPTADEQKPGKSSSQKPIADEQKSSKSSSHKPKSDEQKSSKSSSHKPKSDEQKAHKSSLQKPKADEQKQPKKSSAHKATPDEKKSTKSSSSHKPKKSETPSSVTSKPVVKKSGQPSHKHTQDPEASALTLFESVLNQSESSKSKNTSSTTSSSTGTNRKSSSGKRSSQSDSGRRKDSASSPHAKKQRFDGVDVQGSAESSSKSGCKDHVKRLSAHSDSSAKKKDNKQCKRISAV